MKKTLILSLLLPLLLFCSSCLHAEMPVTFLPSSAKLSQAQLDNIKSVILKHFNLDKSDSPYKSVRLNIQSAESDPVKKIQVVLFFKDKYGVDTYNVVLDKDLKVTKSEKE